MRLELHATPEEVMRAVDALRVFAQARSIAEKTIFELSLALEECASNIVNHALGRDARQVFLVNFEYAPFAVVIELRDGGPAFDPTHVAAIPSSPDEDDRPPGGWGIQLVRHYMDEMQYRREAGQNVLRLTKKLETPAGQK